MTTHRVWFGKFSSTAFNKPGLRHKYPGQPWEAPYPNHITPNLTAEQTALAKQYNAGILVPRAQLAEASAIYNDKYFATQKHVSGGGFTYIVDEPLAEVLSDFDVGPGGLVPYTIYHADEATPIDAKWWMLGLGAQKNTFQGAQSKNVEMLFDGGASQDSVYMPLYPHNDDLAFSAKVLEGPDLWREKCLLYSFGFSDRLGSALVEAGYGDLFGLRTARVVD